MRFSLFQKVSNVVNTNIANEFLECFFMRIVFTVIHEFGNITAQNTAEEIEAAIARKATGIGKHTEIISET